MLQLLVGSDDYEIREFKDDIIVNEISETSSICSLISFSIGRFAYALDNGTVGVYDKFRRVWRVKVKIISIYQTYCIHFFINNRHYVMKTCSFV